MFVNHFHRFELHRWIDHQYQESRSRAQANCAFLTRVTQEASEEVRLEMLQHEARVLDCHAVQLKAELEQDQMTADNFTRVQLKAVCHIMLCGQRC